MITTEHDVETLRETANHHCAQAAWSQALPVLRELWARGYEPALTATNLGTAYMNTCQVPEAIRWFRQALALHPQIVAAQENLIFLTDLQPETTDADATRERHGWWARQGAQAYARRRTYYLNDRDPEKRLRVGYYCGDFNFHSSGIASTAVIRQHSAQIEPVFLSSLPPSAHDATTAFIKEQYPDSFVDVSGFTAPAIADGLHQGAFDIVVDLAGFTHGNGLLALAEKPAPIQIQAWGYVLGTQTPTIDFVFADPVVAPPSVRARLAERVVDLPCVLSFYPRPNLPDPNRLPCLDGEPVTFSVYQRAMKTHAGCYRVWRQILERVPGSRILFKASDYSPEKRDAMMASFRGLEGRVIFEYPTAHKEHLLSYGYVDLALDPWPQTGGVSTLEAAWMGVPTVTLLGERMIQRASASILTALGIARGFVAETEADYIEKAVEWTTTGRVRLNAVRAGMRPMLKASPIMTGYVEAVEQQYRLLWREWCQSQNKEAA